MNMASCSPPGGWLQCRALTPLLHVSRWDMGQTKKSKPTLNKCLLKKVSDILVSSYLTDVCSIDIRVCVFVCVCVCLCVFSWHCFLSPSCPEDNWTGQRCCRHCRHRGQRGRPLGGGGGGECSCGERIRQHGEWHHVTWPKRSWVELLDFNEFHN